MTECGFDLASFYEGVRATPRERNPLRQDLVRGLKDYFESVYGYDRYGAETVLYLRERLHVPHIYGFAAVRILRDRRISDDTKGEVARRALDALEYGSDSGVPFGLAVSLLHLERRGQLGINDLRFALVVSSGEQNPMRGSDKAEALEFFRRLAERGSLPPAERAFWAHTLLARSAEAPGVSHLVDVVLASDSLGRTNRTELCRAWLHCRQPRLAVDVPAAETDPRSIFVAEHMPFWLAHAPSWPSPVMARRALVWLARIEGSAGELAQAYIAERGGYAEHLHAGVADIVAEHHSHMSPSDVQRVIEQGVAMSSSPPTRRRFYRLGTELYGPEYLRRASGDAASSVRQWAARELQKQR